MGNFSKNFTNKLRISKLGAFKWDVIATVLFNIYRGCQKISEVSYIILHKRGLGKNPKENWNSIQNPD